MSLVGRFLLGSFAHVQVGVLALICSWLGARAVERWTADPSTAHGRIRTLAILVAMLTVLPHELLVFSFQTPSVAVDLAGVTSGTGRAAVALTVLLLVPGTASWVGAYMGVYPSMNRVCERTESVGTALGRQARTYFGYVLPVLLLGYAIIFAPPGAGTGLAIAIVYVAYIVTGPVLLSRLNDVRTLDAGERDQFGLAADDYPVWVVDTDDTKSAGGLAAGILPGHRVVVLTSHMLATLSPTTIRAVVEHERAHHRRGHIVGRTLLLALAMGVAAGWLSLHPGTWYVVLVITVLLSPAYFAVARWTERDADREAAERYDGPALADALTELYRVNLLPESPEGFRALLTTHPSLASRVDFLGGETGTLVDG